MHLELDSWQSGQIHLLSDIEQVKPEELIDRMIGLYQETLPKWKQSTILRLGDSGSPTLERLLKPLLKQND